MGRDGSRRAYLSAVVELAVTRVRYRIFNDGSRQTLLSVLGVGLAVALLLVVTSVGLGLAAQGTLQAESTDFWIVPEQSASSVVTDVGGTELGRVHAVSDRLNRREDVAFATPVLVDTVRLTGPDGTTERVFLVGIVPGNESREILGLRTAGLTPGDPYFANGTYNGTWTGEAVLSESAASALNASTESRVAPANERVGDVSFDVVGVSAAHAPGVGQFPVAMVHLSEAQVLTRGTTGDQAGRILVDASDPAVESALAGIYPHSEVTRDRGLLARELASSDLPLAMSLAAAVIGLVVGSLFIVTTVGFQFVSDAETRAVMAALGTTGRTRRLLLVLETFATVLAGGVVGVLAWAGSVVVINAVGRRVVAVPLAVVRPELVAYGLATALCMALVTLPVLLVMTRGRSVEEALPTR